MTLFDGEKITLEEILDARSARAAKQREMLAKGGNALISFALNMPGPVKQSVTARRVFDEGLAEIRNAVGGGIQEEEVFHEKTGSQAFLLLKTPADRVKKTMTDIEEYHPLGRLFDIDVIGTDGVPLSRTQFGMPARTCMVCGGNAKICARSQAHSAEIIAFTLDDLVHTYFRDKEADRVAICATRALLYEVSTTPKPGLVDRNNAGSHDDMDYFTFVDSSATLCHWFRDMFCVGWDHADEIEEALFRRLQFVGKMADRAMFHATGGVNTHQGLIYAVTIIAAAIGKRMRLDSAEAISEKDLIDECRKIGRCSLREKFGDSAEGKSGESGGSSAYGARGEAADGFPHAISIGLPAIRRWLAEGCSLNEASCAALLAVIAETEDTNMIRRGGSAEAERRRQEAQEIYRALTAENIVSDISKLDTDYIRCHLSPGGSADILAISLFFCFCEEDGILSNHA